MLKPQGRRGEVAAELHSDFPERFAQRTRLFALAPSGARRELELEDFWPHKGRMVLKFRGVDSIDQAQALAGCEIQIPEEERAPLEAGAAYVSDLVGCELVDAGRNCLVGTVEDVVFGAGEAPLLSVRAGGRELMVPFAQEFLRRVDLERKRIEMVLPEGLLELDQPKADGEKN